MSSEVKRGGPLVVCTVCRQPKAPRGRSAPMGMPYCAYECPGHREPPYPGDLWPGETSDEFGYPCQTSEELAAMYARPRPEGG